MLIVVDSDEISFLPAADQEKVHRVTWLWCEAKAKLWHLGRRPAVLRCENGVRHFFRWQ